MIGGTFSIIAAGEGTSWLIEERSLERSRVSFMIDSTVYHSGRSFWGLGAVSYLGDTKTSFICLLNVILENVFFRSGLPLKNVSVTF